MIQTAPKLRHLTHKLRQNHLVIGPQLNCSLQRGSCGININLLTDYHRQA